MRDPLTYSIKMLNSILSRISARVSGIKKLSTDSAKKTDEKGRPSILYRLWIVSLAASGGLGVYLLLGPKKNPETSTQVDEKVPDTVEQQSTDLVSADLVQPAVKAAENATPVISEEEQLQMYKWMLDEKRKVKPANKAEKKKIDEEKAALKELIRSKEIPKL